VRAPSYPTAAGFATAPRGARACPQGFVDTGLVTVDAAFASHDATSRAALRVDDAEGEARRIALGGRLDVDGAGALWHEALDAVRSAESGAVIVDASGLDDLDTAGAALLGALQRAAREAGRTFAIEGLAPAQAQIVAMLAPAEEPQPREEPPRRSTFLRSLGRATVVLGRDLRELMAFTGELTVFVLATLRHPRALRFKDAVLVADRAGIGAVPIVVLVGFLLGLILAFQGAIPMQRFGAEIFVADLLGISMLRELGPLMAAILLTARSGSAFAAEIGTMKVNEEIDALSTMGLEPVRFLVVPRVLAAIAVVPALTALTSLAAMAGGLVVFLQLGFPAVTFWSRIVEAVTVSDVVGGFAKGIVFGVIVAAVGCLRGLQTGSGAQAVGESTTSAVVSGIILIAVADGVFAVVFYTLGL
jgi:phospholipid/cholesterol/gamma-HCH transport system permease protein